MKKQWHRINVGAQRFGTCHDQVSQSIVSGLNDNDILELAHKLFEVTEKKKLFAKYQERQQKDVERAFGVLQAGFAIIRGLARF